MKITCIYKITTPLNEVYIGGTTDFKNRMRVYRYNKNRRQRRISESISKYGFNGHDINIVHELPADASQEILDKYEQLYIDAYTEAGVIMLNIKGAGRNGKHNDETLKMMRAAKIGKKCADAAKLKMSIAKSGGNHPNSRKVVDTVTGKIYNYVGEAAGDLGVTSQHLSQMLRGSRNNKTTFKYL